MSELLDHDQSTIVEPKTIEKVAIVISRGSLEGIYPGLIMANGARMEGIAADIFFTFFGLDAIRMTATSTSRWRPSATRGCTCRRCSGRCPASPRWRRG